MLVFQITEVGRLGKHGPVMSPVLSDDIGRLVRLPEPDMKKGGRNIFQWKKKKERKKKAEARVSMDYRDRSFFLKGNQLERILKGVESLNNSKGSKKSSTPVDP